MTELIVSSPKLNCVKSCLKLSSEKASGRNVGGMRLISASGLKALSTIQTMGRSTTTMRAASTITVPLGLRRIVRRRIAAMPCDGG